MTDTPRVAHSILGPLRSNACNAFAVCTRARKVAVGRPMSLPWYAEGASMHADRNAARKNGRTRTSWFTAGVMKYAQVYAYRCILCRLKRK